MAHPVCPRLGDALEESAKELGLPVTRGGTYLVMEGPQFSTLAESNLYRSWGCSVIGMTNMPEAKLAREAEICYATVAMVTDFDCWHEDHDAVTVDAVIKVLLGNADKARGLVKSVLPKIGAARGPCPAGLRPRAGIRADHRARGARSGDAGKAECGRRASPLTKLSAPGRGASTRPGRSFSVRRQRRLHQAGGDGRTSPPRSWHRARARPWAGRKPGPAAARQSRGM